MRPRLTCLFLLVFAAGEAGAQPAPGTEAARNMALVGYHDLAGRPSYQPTLQQIGGRWIAFVGHHGGSARNPLTGVVEVNGTSILDVTDARKPRLLKHIPGSPETLFGGAQHARVCAGTRFAAGNAGRTFLLRTFGTQAHEIFDVTSPEKPRLLARIDGLEATHKNFWECDSGIAYLVSGAPGWRKFPLPNHAVNFMTQVYDLSDPAKPRFIRNFGLPGQQPGKEGPVPPAVHSAFSLGAERNRVYFAYGITREGILQIVDRSKLLEGPADPSDENLRLPEISRLSLPEFYGAHTGLPVFGIEIPALKKYGEPSTRDFVVLLGEATAPFCSGTRQLVWMVDVTDERHPVSVATYAIPEEPVEFCKRGGRFGPHGANESFIAKYHRRIVFISGFNAGVRAIDIRDPFHPREIGYFLPAVTAATTAACRDEHGKRECAPAAVQTNNVEVDGRGYVYLVDRANTGMHIVELTIGDL